MKVIEPYTAVCLQTTPPICLNNKEENMSKIIEKRSAVLGVAVTFLLTFMIGLSTSVIAEEFRIGAVIPLTGPIASAGSKCKMTYEFAQKEINEAGGIKSLGGMKVKFIYGDTQSKPEVAISETNRLIEQEHVSVLTEGWQSFVTLAATQAAERLKTPYMVPVSYADAITARGFKYTFQLEPKATVVARDWVRFLGYFRKATGKKVEKVGLLYESTDMGQSNAAAAKKFLQEASYVVAGDISFLNATPDLSATVAKMKAFNPDFVLEAAYINDAINLSRTRNRLALFVPFISNGSCVDPEYIQNLGPLAEGMFDISMWSSDLPGGGELNKRYKAFTGFDLTGLQALIYQGALVIKESAEIARSADKEKIRNALATLHIKPGPKLVLPYEGVKFDETGYNSLSRFIVAQVQQQKWVTVFPEEVAPVKPWMNPKWK
jgi:branched-chain amino acid transport system substrate-binding protein